MLTMTGPAYRSGLASSLLGDWRSQSRSLLQHLNPCHERHCTMFSSQCLHWSGGMKSHALENCPASTGDRERPPSHTTPHSQGRSQYLLPGRAKHGLLDVRVHPAQGIVSSWNALEVTQSTVLVPHHLLHHGRVTSQFHRLGEEGKSGKLRPTCTMKGQSGSRARSAAKP